MEVDQQDEDADWHIVPDEEDKVDLERFQVVSQEDKDNERHAPAENKDIKDELVHLELGLESLKRLAREMEADPNVDKVEMCQMEVVEKCQIDVDQKDEDKDWHIVRVEEDKDGLERLRLLRQEDADNAGHVPAENKDIKDELVQLFELGLESLKLLNNARQMEADPDEGKVDKDEDKAQHVPDDKEICPFYRCRLKHVRDGDDNKEIKHTGVQDELIVQVELWLRGDFEGRWDRQYGRFGQWQVEQKWPWAQGAPGP